jgi:hypothetical protein
VSLLPAAVAAIPQGRAVARNDKRAAQAQAERKAQADDEWFAGIMREVTTMSANLQTVADGVTEIARRYKEDKESDGG